MSDPKNTSFLYCWRVRAGTLAAAAVIIFARPKAESLAAGMILSLIGLGLRSWAAGHLRKEKKLAISGPYKHTRNPLYLGNLIIGAGIAAGSWSWIVLSVLAAYFIIFYPVVIRVEKLRMQTLFADQYADYEKSVPLLLPRIGKSGIGDDTAFSSALHAKNREWRAIAGTAFFWALLAAKMMILK
jgi:protein-S-isoprenylcysteine O-methyltransferase Ste14